MNQSGIAKSYAKALLEISLEAQNTDALESELRDISGVLKSSPEIWEFLVSPRVAKKAKDSALDSAFSGKINQSLLSTLHILVRNDRIVFLNDIIDQYSELNDARKGIIRVEVFSAVKLQDAVLNDIKAWCKTSFKANNCETKETIKPELIGGVVVKYGDLVYDFSMRRKLNSIQAHILGDMQTLLSGDKVGTYYEN